MIIQLNGKGYTLPELLIYWIRERHLILIKKRSCKIKPWSDDPVFQRTYFCNVHRENDKVTKWIRNFYSQYADDPMFEYNIILSRFINWPNTLAMFGYMRKHEPKKILEWLEGMASRKEKIWGNAYVITTHGLPMPKATYLCENVLEGVHRRLEELRNACRGTSLAHAAQVLETFEGVGPFLAGQVVADLKNTKRYPLLFAKDWLMFVVPGPGSVRGASWFHYGNPDEVSYTTFLEHFLPISQYVKTNWPAEVPSVCHQDLQNCLCEFDKYLRVKTGSGRSKRNYNGF